MSLLKKLGYGIVAGYIGLSGCTSEVDQTKHYSFSEETVQVTKNPTEVNGPFQEFGKECEWYKKQDCIKDDLLENLCNYQPENKQKFPIEDLGIEYFSKGTVE